MKLVVLGLCGRSVFLRVDHFHKPGETLHAAELHAEPGGKGFNQAVAAARLGAEVTFITCVGADQDGEACLASLEREGIRPVAQITQSAHTACASILTDREGENQVTVYRGAAEELTADFIRQNESLIAQSEMVLLNHEYPESCNLEVLDLAEKHGVPVILNPAPARNMDEKTLRRFSLMTPNRAEAEMILGRKVERIEAFPSLFRERGIRRAVVTLGGEGALLVDGGRAWHFPAIPCTVRDTTGAGDTFTAAMAVALLRGEELIKAVEYAVNASACSVSRRYVLPGLPTRLEVEANYVIGKPMEME